MPAPAKNQQPKLLDEVRRVLRVQHYFIHTERSYIDWAVRFIRFHHMHCPEDLFSLKPPLKKGAAKLGKLRRGRVLSAK